MTIEFNFTVIPRFFEKNGYLEPKKDGSHFKVMFLLHYLFSRCQSVPRSHYHHKNLIHFKPWEFICGRKEVSEATGLTEKEVRGQLNRWENEEILKKGANSRANQYTTYIWSTEVFFETKGQLKGQRRANGGPTQGPQIRSKKARTLEDRKEGILAFVEKEQESAFLPALCLPSISQEKKEMGMQIEFFIERTKDSDWPFERGSIQQWLNNYTVGHLIETFELIRSRKTPKDYHAYFCNALNQDWVGEKKREVENKLWAQDFLVTNKINCCKLLKQYCKLKLDNSDENYYYKDHNFKLELSRKLENLGINIG